MASYMELFFDWNLLAQSADENYNNLSSSDIRLASEIGTRLLERCKDLEDQVTHQQSKIDEQMSEIEQLAKHTAALNEVNNSRLKIYEELEDGIIQLEHQNHILLIENNSHKSHIKSTNMELQKSDSKCFDLNEVIKQLQKELISEKRKTEILKEKNQPIKTFNDNFLEKCELDLDKSDGISVNKSEAIDIIRTNISLQGSPDDNENYLKILIELDKTKMALKFEQSKVFELEDQMSSIIQENQNLQYRFAQETLSEKMKSVQEEFTVLEEVREGTMCSKCLNLVNDQISFDACFSIGETETYDNDSLLELINEQPSIKLIPETSTSLKQSSYNDFIEKYEALVQVHKAPARKFKCSNSDSKSQEKNFNNISEEDTSSSGFSEPTHSEDGSLSANRSHERFLCTLEDGDDCKINIYDASKNNCSRFRNITDYREIYKEISAICEKSYQIMLPRNIDKTSSIKKQLKNINEIKKPDSSVSERTIIEKDNKNKMKNKLLNKKDNIKKSEESSSKIIENDVSKVTAVQENFGVDSKRQEQNPYEFILVTKKNRKNNRNSEKSDKMAVPNVNGIKDKKRSVNNLPSVNKINNTNNVKSRIPTRNSNNNSTQSPSSKNFNPKMTSTDFKPSTLSKGLSKLKQLEVSYANVLRVQ